MSHLSVADGKLKLVYTPFAEFIKKNSGEHDESHGNRREMFLSEKKKNEALNPEGTQPRRHLTQKYL